MGSTGQTRAIWTIGHSNRPAEATLALLTENEIETLVDVRSFTGSRKNPQYGQEAMGAWLGEAGITYLQLGELGGRRHTVVEGSGNEGWRHPAFRSYADYMRTGAFAAGLTRLVEIAAQSRTAYMCSEAVPWRCHRSLISDALTARGWAVRHIVSSGRTRAHVLGAWGATPVVGADATISYPAC